MAKKKAGAATKKKAPGKGTARVQWKTEAIPMPIPDRVPPKKKKGTDEVSWRTEVIPMPIPPGRKPPTPKKKLKKR